MFFNYFFIILLALINLTLADKDLSKLISYYNDLTIILESYDEPAYIKCNNCIGIEMEIGFDKRYPNLARWNNFTNSIVFNKIKWKNIMNLKYDSSVPRGIELNFQPMQYKIIKNINWKNFFDLINLEQAFNDIDTGLHLHISGNNNLLKIAEFIFKNKKELVNFMRRDNSFYSYFCDYQQFKNHKLCIDKFSVINKHQFLNTIEIRGFKMPLNHTLFLEYIEFMNMLELYSNNQISDKQILNLVKCQKNKIVKKELSDHVFYKISSFTILFVLFIKKIEKLFEY